MIDSSEKFKIHSHANGSHTLVDTENGQAMHSRIGPRLEADLVYAEPSEIETLLTSDREIVLYDVGMGLSANVLAVLERIRLKPEAKGTLSITSFETKPEGLATALSNLSAFPMLADWAQTLRTLLADGSAELSIGDVQIEWRLIREDFYAALDSSPVPDIIFFDFYSPKVVPELWSLERFQRLREKIGDHPCRIFTYSASTPVRLHLFAAGFFVGLGPSTGVKTETTIASTDLSLLKKPLSKTWLNKLETSTSIRTPEFAPARLAASRSFQWSIETLK